MVGHHLVLLRHALPGIKNEKDYVDCFDRMLGANGRKIIERRINAFFPLEPGGIKQAKFPHFLLPFDFIVQIKFNRFTGCARNVADNQAIHIQQSIAKGRLSHVWPPDERYLRSGIRIVIRRRWRRRKSACDDRQEIVHAKTMLGGNPNRLFETQAVEFGN